MSVASPNTRYWLAWVGRQCLFKLLIGALSFVMVWMNGGKGINEQLVQATWLSCFVVYIYIFSVSPFSKIVRCWVDFFKKLVPSSLNAHPQLSFSLSQILVIMIACCTVASCSCITSQKRFHTRSKPQFRLIWIHNFFSSGLGLGCGLGEGFIFDFIAGNRMTSH